MLNRGSRRGVQRESVWHLFRHFPRLLPFVRPHWKLSATSISMIGLSALLGLAGPWPLAIVIDTILGPQHLPGFAQSLFHGLGAREIIVIVVVAGLVLTALGQALGVVDTYVNTKLNLRLTFDFRRAVYAHVQQLSLEFHDRVPTGNLMFKLGAQVGSIGQIVVAIPPIAQALLTAVGMLAVALLLDWQLALLALAMVPFIIYSTRYYAQRIVPRLYEVRQLEMDSQSIMYEGLAMIRVIMSFGREQSQQLRWRQQARRANEARIQLTLRQTLFSVAIGAITATGTALVLGFGALAVLDHRLTVGELVVLLGYITAIYQPIQQVTSSFGMLQQQLVNFEAALELLDLEPAVQDAPGALDLPSAAGRITFTNVRFRYEAARGAAGSGLSTRAAQDTEDGAPKPSSGSQGMLAIPEVQVLLAKCHEIGLDPQARFGPKKDTLVDVSFDAAPGRHIAIVGPTGAGKTTILNLIMRFYEPTHGVVSLDGIDIRRLKVASVRQHISVVLQEPMLFAGTIAENILYAKPEAGQATMIAAAKAANVHDFISELPDAYETVIGERGSQLSQGERQRISIARAFLRDSPVLLLDEPTSSIDAQTEAVIIAALDRLMQSRTTFTVAHRLSTVRRADLILVLDHGRLVQTGTHEQLTSREGLYKRLHDYQFGIDSFDELPEQNGRADVPFPALGALVAVDLLIAALTIVIEDDSVESLRVALERLPRWLRQPSLWLLIGAILEVLHDGSDATLRELTRRTRDPHPLVQGLARIAASVLESRELLVAVAHRAAAKAPVTPLDPDRLRSAPWSELAKVSPLGAALVKEFIPVSGADLVSGDKRLPSLIGGEEASGNP